VKTSELIPLEPQEWCKNPEGFVIHQRYLVDLVRYLERNDVKVELPEDNGSWDRGVDIQVDGQLNIDIKGFGLIEGPKSFTWNSGFWKGKNRPLYNESLTHFFIHPHGKSVGEWVVAKATELRTSYMGLQPFYYKDSTMTVDDLIASVK
jgi:hypothetical protein